MLPQPDGTANATSGYDDDSGGFARGSRRPMRKDRDDKVHDSIIEERIQRERPCRTLFIRNIKASTFRDPNVLVKFLKRPVNVVRNQ